MSILLKKYLSFKRAGLFAGAVFGLFLLMATPAYAGVGVGVAPDFPATVTVGQSGVAVGLEITNNSTPDVGSVDLSNIRLIPSCGDGDADTTTCAGAEVDPGVFTVSGTGTGANACLGTSFTIATNDVITGQVLFTPSSTITLAQGATCRINFTVNVNQAPTDDSSGAAGLQTLQIGRVSATRTGNTLSGTGLGTDETTVIPPSHIIVDKVTNPSGSLQSFSFDGVGGSYGDFSLTDAAAPNDQTLAPGAYSVSETLPTGWDQTSATCVSSIEDNETPASLELDPGETITCTFTNTQRGHIIVDKITNPAADPQSFNFDGSGAGYNDFSLTDVADPNNQEVVPGAYSVSETVPAGWFSDGGVCDNGETPASLDVNPGETVTCTFTNTKGSVIIVDKVTNPSGSSQSFSFTTSGSGYNGFSLTDAATPNSQTVAAGSYTVAETAVAGWSSDGGVCDGDETPGSIDVGPGETVTCAFTNTLQMGHIIVDKVTNPSGDPQSFSFNATGSGYDDFSLTDAASLNNQELVVGTYSVSETLPAGWDQTSATCVSSLGENEIETIGNLELDSGETITCTFTNTKDVVQWCSPGYWRNHEDSAQEAASAGGFALTDTYASHFGSAPALKNKALKDGAVANPTLWQVLQSPQWYGSDAFNKVGDLLSDSHPDLDFDEGDPRVENCPLN